MPCLVRPALEHLPSYQAALSRGWSPNNVRPEAAQEELQAIQLDPAAFVASLDDPLATGRPVVLPDGQQVPRLPGFARWIWDGEFVGSINLRWQNGTPELPPHCLGHIGYAVVPWKRGLGFATRALAELLPHARAVGLPYVDLTTDPENRPSQRVIESNGGWLVERFEKIGAYGGAASLRYRIDLAPPAG